MSVRRAPAAVRAIHKNIESTVRTEGVHPRRLQHLGPKPAKSGMRSGPWALGSFASTHHHVSTATQSSEHPTVWRPVGEAADVSALRRLAPRDPVSSVLDAGSLSEHLGFLPMNYGLICRATSDTGIPGHNGTRLRPARSSSSKRNSSVITYQPGRIHFRGDHKKACPEFPRTPMYCAPALREVTGYERRSVDWQDSHRAAARGVVTHRIQYYKSRQDVRCRSSRRKCSYTAVVPSTGAAAYVRAFLVGDRVPHQRRGCIFGARSVAQVYPVDSSEASTAEVHEPGPGNRNYLSTGHNAPAKHLEADVRRCAGGHRTSKPHLCQLPKGTALQRCHQFWQPANTDGRRGRLQNVRQWTVPGNIRFPRHRQAATSRKHGMGGTLRGGFSAVPVFGSSFTQKSALPRAVAESLDIPTVSSSETAVDFWLCRLGGFFPRVDAVLLSQSQSARMRWSARPASGKTCYQTLRLPFDLHEVPALLLLYLRVKLVKSERELAAVKEEGVGARLKDVALESVLEATTDAHRIADDQVE
ncbi:hypothetical protein LXA43DRAFT_1131537 [Ganoderma leucocontextum]|nr:hypothetical protein LXA43DRAFT_1131537 [Ganoderma leucocontextum]